MLKCLFFKKKKHILEKNVHEQSSLQANPTPSDIHAALQFTSVVYEDHSST